MSFEQTAKSIVWKNTVDPFNRISAKVGAARLADKPGVMVAQTLKEGLVRLPLENIANISAFAVSKIFKLMGKTAGLSLKAAMLIPLPVIGSVAEARGKVNAFQKTIDLKARGDTKDFSELFNSVRGVRKEAEARVLPQAAA